MTILIQYKSILINLVYHFLILNFILRNSWHLTCIYHNNIQLLHWNFILSINSLSTFNGLIVPYSVSSSALIGDSSISDWVYENLLLSFFFNLVSIWSKLSCPSLVLLQFNIELKWSGNFLFNRYSLTYLLNDSYFLM